MNLARVRQINVTTSTNAVSVILTAIRMSVSYSCTIIMGINLHFLDVTTLHSNAVVVT